MRARILTKEEHGETERPVDQEGAVTTASTSDEHGQRGTSNDKVEEPLRGSSHGDVHGSKTGSRDLTDVDPADRTPAKLEEGCEQEDADLAFVSSNLK